MPPFPLCESPALKLSALTQNNKSAQPTKIKARSQEEHALQGLWSDKNENKLPATTIGPDVHRTGVVVIR
jgi:hypothetical protein